MPATKEEEKNGHENVGCGQSDDEVDMQERKQLITMRSSEWTISGVAGDRHIPAICMAEPAACTIHYKYNPLNPFT